MPATGVRSATAPKLHPGELAHPAQRASGVRAHQAQLGSGPSAVQQERAPRLVDGHDPPHPHSLAASAAARPLGRPQVGREPAPGVAKQVAQLVGEHGQRRSPVQRQYLPIQSAGDPVARTQRRAGRGEACEHRLTHGKAEAGGPAGHHAASDLNRRAAGRGQPADQGSGIQRREFGQKLAGSARSELRMGEQQGERTTAPGPERTGRDRRRRAAP